MTSPSRARASTNTAAARSRGMLKGAAPVGSPSASGRIADIIADVGNIVPPVWPLEDYVAVNPFLGLSAARFLDARGLLRDVRDCELLPSARHFLGRFGLGEITMADVEEALKQCREEYPELYDELAPQDLVEALQEAAVDFRADGTSPGDASERRYSTVSEAIDRRQGSSWSSHIVNEISRLLAAHYDRGQAAWPSPFRHLPLYEAWRELSRSSRRMEMLGIRGFRRFVAELPADPEAAVEYLLVRLGIPDQHWRPFLLCQLFSMAGWASFLRYRFWQAQAADAGTFDEHVIGLLTMRLAYDVALAETSSNVAGVPDSVVPVELADEDAALRRFHRGVPVSRAGLARYCFQVAAEKAYEYELTGKLRGRAGAPPSRARKTLQMIFCIDVRSEVFRRHLEAAGDNLQTFGFAGFFAMPLEVVPLAMSQGPAQCPVLLTPGFRVHERLRGASGEEGIDEVVRRRRQVRLGRKIWKVFQTSATSCFSFVESLGLAYLPKLLTDSLGWTRPVMRAQADGLGGRPVSLLMPGIQSCGPDALTVERKVDLAAGMLRNLGLTTDFARIVVICGHGAEVVNNPYKAGLDCGACGGHSGEPNARVAAGLLNDREVRSGLADRGIEIPADTWFAPAVHVTTTDEVRFFDTDCLPADHAEEFAIVQHWLARAGAATRLERTRRLGDAARKGGEADILRRSRDWSEVRPEWGLAGNAAFVVAPRTRTAGLDLGGRTFLHDYEHARDPELKVLELIMTAPMIVTSWINLQYFASAVDNRAFGSGNKQIHNVTGQLGVLLGNGGDLMTGLSWQAVSDGERLQHEPLRLLVLIEAPREAVQTIIERHAMVRELVSNGWLRLVVREGDLFFRWTADQQWRPAVAGSARETDVSKGRYEA